MTSRCQERACWDELSYKRRQVKAIWTDTGGGTRTAGRSRASLGHFVDLVQVLLMRYIVCTNYVID